MHQTDLYFTGRMYRALYQSARAAVATYHRLGHLKRTDVDFLTVLEARSARSRSSRVGFWGGLAPWLVDGCLRTVPSDSLSVYMWGEGMNSPVCLLRRTPILLDQGCSLMTSFDLRPLCREYAKGAVERKQKDWAGDFRHPQKDSRCLGQGGGQEEGVTVAGFWTHFKGRAEGNQIWGGREKSRMVSRVLTQVTGSVGATD